jgi:tetratricopeptide (TPR) repeat protein
MALLKTIDLDRANETLSSNMRLYTSTLLWIIVLSLKTDYGQSFLPSPGQLRVPASSHLYDMPPCLADGEDHGNGNGPETKDQTKEAIQEPNERPIIHWLVDENSLPKNNNTVQKQRKPFLDEWKEQLEATPMPPLTAVRRARLERETSLLEQLLKDDDAVEELHKLWTQERGSAAAEALAIVDRFLTARAWLQAETVLVLMIQEKGVHFVAPIAKLAKLYFFQGRWKESKQLYEMVLSQKPWHIEALRGMHGLCKATNDYKGLMLWDRNQLPLLEEERRGRTATRVEWVHRMVEKARSLLQEGEDNLQGFLDSGYNTLGSEGSVLVDDEHSWQ